MKDMKLLACAGLLAAAMASPSLAAELPTKAPGGPVFVAPFSWSGFYVGINGGYGWGTAKLTNSLGTQSFNTNGGLVGATLGYNIQTGNWVWGIEGDWDWSGIKGSSSSAPLCAIGSNCSVETEWLATVRGRIGYAWDRWLPYFTGGGAFGDVKMTGSTGNSQTDTRAGWTVGAGVEWAFMGNWSAKLEYLYVDLGTKTCSTTVCLISTDTSVTDNLVRAGVNYRF